MWRIFLTSGSWREFTNGEQFEAGLWELVQAGEVVDRVEFNGLCWPALMLRIQVDEIRYAVAGGEP